MINAIGQCFPPEDVISMTRVTSKSFYHYNKDELVDKLLLIQDFDGLDEEAQYAFRELQSAGNISSSTTYKDKAGNLISAVKTVRSLPKQYRILDRYINENRKDLIRDKTEALVIGKLGTALTADDIHYLVSTYKMLFPDRNLTPATIRQSVVSNWLNEKKLPLEQVQLLAGHRWISSTAKYRQHNMEQQRELMNKWFPV